MEIKMIYTTRDIKKIGDTLVTNDGKYTCKQEAKVIDYVKSELTGREEYRMRFSYWHDDRYQIGSTSYDWTDVDDLGGAVCKLNSILERRRMR